MPTLGPSVRESCRTVERTHASSFSFTGRPALLTHLANHRGNPDAHCWPLVVLQTPSFSMLRIHALTTRAATHTLRSVARPAVLRPCCAARCLSTIPSAAPTAAAAAPVEAISPASVAAAEAATAAAAAVISSAGSTERKAKKSKSSAAGAAAAPASNWSPIKGTHDYFPASASRQRALELLCAKTAASFNYGEVRTPVLERSDLFSRTLGAESDVVSKEMFLFDDHGTNTVLRPENTASKNTNAMHEEKRSKRRPCAGALLTFAIALLLSCRLLQVSPVPCFTVV